MSAPRPHRTSPELVDYLAPVDSTMFLRLIRHALEGFFIGSIIALALFSAQAALPEPWGQLLVLISALTACVMWVYAMTLAIGRYLRMNGLPLL